MTAHEQWRQIAKTYEPDFRREFSTRDVESARFADQVDRIGSLAGGIFAVGLLLLVVFG